MASAAYELFRAAILGEKQVTCTYDGFYRELCPHIIGRKDGSERVLAFQFGGQSSKPLPPGGDWKCLILSKVREAATRDGPWYEGEQHGSDQHCIDDVDIDVNIHVRHGSHGNVVKSQMTDVLARVQALVLRSAVIVSRHGFRELAADDIVLVDVLTGIETARLVEDYSDTGRGPSVLVLTEDSEGRPLHVVWGLPNGQLEPAVLVTAYRPDPARWSTDWMRRKKP